MGAVALIGLLAGGPLGVCFALAYGVVTVMKIAKVDSQYAARGETPPTYRLIEKWLDGRKAHGQAPKDAKPARYGMWRYAWQRWKAMWELMADDHRTRFEREKAARAEAREKGLPLPKKPPLRERLAGLKAWRWTLDTLVTPVGENKPAPASRPVAVDPAPVDGPRTACPDCGQTLTDRNGTWEHPSSAGCPNTAADDADVLDTDTPFHAGMVARVQRDDAHNTDQWCGVANCPACRQAGRLCTTCGAGATRGPLCRGCDYNAALNDPTSRLVGQPEPDANTTHAALNDPPGREPSDWTFTCPWGCGYWSGGGTRQEAQDKFDRHLPVCPDKPKSETKGETIMTTTSQATRPQQSGEVTGIPSAVNYLRQMAATHQQHADNEAIVGALRGFNAGQGDIRLVQAAIAASQNAADLFTKAADELDRRNAGVRQGYASAPDAADKHAQLAE